MLSWFNNPSLFDGQTATIIGSSANKHWIWIMHIEILKMICLHAWYIKSLLIEMLLYITIKVVACLNGSWAPYSLIPVFQCRSHFLHVAISEVVCMHACSYNIWLTTVSPRQTFAWLQLLAWFSMHGWNRRSKTKAAINLKWNNNIMKLSWWWLVIRCSKI